MRAAFKFFLKSRAALKVWSFEQFPQPLLIGCSCHSGDFHVIRELDDCHSCPGLLIFRRFLSSTLKVQQLLRPHFIKSVKLSFVAKNQTDKPHLITFERILWLHFIRSIKLKKYFAKNHGQRGMQRTQTERNADREEGGSFSLMDRE